ncbi:aldo/keto reductase [Halomonas huangheensis]|uniref:NADP-dependent oxidoreductase domain-containing protein n=1 Tax=Halomonas huangheensis TaxID=1178482 RepID=W1N6Q2_9GAMM|nr:aldo/keto reductase [Halomonas huangheensis]ALM52068.1 aldo/keto reductase [Halomonas huangheensis]ERL50625.1 hypothetical protein BJB45_05705 [Halomonas huangheensis]
MAPVTHLLNTSSDPTIGLGCMNLCHAYGTPLTDAEALHALREAFEMGYRHFDTATLYGATLNEKLVGEALAPYRNQLFLASKCGMARDPELQRKVIDGRPEVLRRQCEESLVRLKTDHLDLYYLHRLDFQIPIEESVGELGRLVEEGKIRGIGLSEVSASTLRRAASEHPITALQSEYSLWTRNPEVATLAACRELGTAFVAFSPVGRGFLGGKLKDVSTLVEGDVRLGMPRFSAENYPRNLERLQDVLALAEQLDCTPAQLALAWLRSQGDDILPIPGTRSIAHMQENLAASDILLAPEVVARLDDMLRDVDGDRYSEAQLKEIDTESVPAAER